MKRIKFVFLGLLISLFSQTSLYSEGNFLSNELMSELRAKGSIRKISVDSNEKLTLCPDTPLSKKAITTWNLNEKPKLVSENLFLVKKSELEENSLFDDSIDTSIANVSKIMRSISKMKGMKYYSNSKKKWTTLYKKAYVVKSIKDKNPLLDVIDGSADGLNIYCYLEDNSFGGYVYSVNYKQRENEVSFCLSNSEGWSYYGIDALDPYNMKINMVVIDNEDSFVIYMVLQAKYTSVPLIGDMLQKSLANRIDAIFNWFKLQF